MAERSRAIGVPVFMADVKGDLAGHRAGRARRSPKLAERAQAARRSTTPAFAACPAMFWDVFGEQGHPVRATISDMGPLLLARLLDLNDTQEGVLTLAFKIADDNGLLLLDLKDLRAMLQYVGDNAQRVHDRLRQRLGRERSARSSAACSRSSSRAATSSSASRCSTSTT